MAAPSFISKSNNETVAGTDITVTAPVSIQDDDVLWASGNAHNDDGTWTYPDGSWVEVDQFSGIAGNPDRQTFIAYKVASSESGDYTFSYDDSGEERSVSITVWRNVHTDILDVTYNSTNHRTDDQNDATPINDPITTNNDDSTVLIFHLPNLDDIDAAAAPSGYTLRDSIVGSTLDQRQQAVASKEIGTATTETPTAWLHSVSTAAAADYTLYTVALKSADVVAAHFDMSGTARNPAVGLLNDLVDHVGLNEADGNRIGQYNSNSLTDVNTVGSKTGVVGLAADFVTVNAEKLQGATDSTFASKFDFSVMIWAEDAAAISVNLDAKFCGKYEAVDANRDWMFGYKATVAESEFIVWYNGSNGFDIAASTDTIFDGAPTGWNCFFGWRSSFGTDQVHIQVDDNAVVDQDTTAPTLNNGGDRKFTIGGLDSTLYDYGDGALDNCAVWDRSFQQEERDWLYNGRSSRAFWELHGARGNITKTLASVSEAGNPFSHIYIFD